jgi:hypothetical protein
MMYTLIQIDYHYQEKRGPVNFKIPIQQRAHLKQDVLTISVANAMHCAESTGILQVRGGGGPKLAPTVIPTSSFRQVLPCE